MAALHPSATPLTSVPSVSTRPDTTTSTMHFSSGENIRSAVRGAVVMSKLLFEVAGQTHGQGDIRPRLVQRQVGQAGGAALVAAGLAANECVSPDAFGSELRRRA